MKTVIGLLIIGLCACQTHKGGSTSRNLKDSVKTISLKTPSKIHSSILGVWKIVGDDNPSFEIKKDSIFYIDQGESYKYDISKDSIIIQYSDWVYRGIYKVDNNILMLYDGNNKVKYVKESE